MRAFAAALSTIFSDTNMAAAALYRPRRGGSPFEVQVIRSSPDRDTDFGEARVVTESMRIEVRVADVSEPADGDRLDIGAERLVVQGQPVRDEIRLTWQLDVVPEDGAP